MSIKEETIDEGERRQTLRRKALANEAYQK